MNDLVFSQIDFGLLMPLLQDDDITDISYSNGGVLWVKTLTQGVQKRDVPGVNNETMEKLAFQCSNVMGKTFNMAHPFLDAESAELRLNFVHESIATNGIAVLIRKTPAKIRLNKDKLIKEDYVSLKLHDFLMKCVEGHCNILVSGETGSGKTELVKYLASHTKVDEKIITIEDTLELHLDKIYPDRDIVAMKTNNIASYSDVLVTCMRQNPKWILLSEVRSAEAVLAVRNSISSGHNIISTIHSDKASAIPMRLYSLLETSQDIDQFVKSMHRYIQLGIHVKGYFSKKYNRFQREIVQVVEFYVDDDANEAKVNILYERDLVGNEKYNNPTSHLIDYLASQGVLMREDPFIPKEGVLRDSSDEPIEETSNEEKKVEDNSANSNVSNTQAPVVNPVVNNTNTAPAKPIVNNANDGASTQSMKAQVNTQVPNVQSVNAGIVNAQRSVGQTLSAQVAGGQTATVQPVNTQKANTQTSSGAINTANNGFKGNVISIPPGVNQID